MRILTARLAAALFGPLLAALMLLLAMPSLAATPDLDLTVRLDPGTGRLRAQALVVPESRDFRFMLHASLKVTAADAGGKPLKVAEIGRDGPVRGWSVVLPAGAKRLRLAYEGTLPVLDQALDHRDVLHHKVPMASSAGTFLQSGSAWYPQPGSLFTYRVDVSVPAPQRAVVPGRLMRERVPVGGKGTYRARFESALPAAGIDLMAGPWVVREKIVPRKNDDALRLRTYFPPEIDAISGLADGYLDDALRYTDYYSARIGAYPFPGFSVVASPLPVGFGMPTLTYLGNDVITLPFIRSSSLGHEVLHNWWGNGVYVDYEQGNWSEGLTTFMADYAYKEQESAEAAREMRLSWLRDFAALPADGHQPLTAFRSRAHGAAAAVGYGKAAMLFVMLRDQIGVKAFDEGIRRFWDEHRFERAGWDDLRAAFEDASRRSLRTFFDQWLTRPGAPRLSLSTARMHSSPGKGDMQIDLTLEQTQPPYRLQVPIEIVYADRSEMRVVDFSTVREEVSLTVPALPLGVRLDPDLRLWRMLAPEQLPPILRQWFLARAPRLLQVSEAKDVRAAAASLAQRLFEARAEEIDLAAIKAGSASSSPVMLIGLDRDVDRTLAAAGLPPRPAEVTGKGSAQVWTVMQDGSVPVAVVSADSAKSLLALQRPLPHYGQQSWLVFDGRRALGQGVWRTPGQLVQVKARPGR